MNDIWDIARANYERIEALLKSEVDRDAREASVWEDDE